MSKHIKNHKANHNSEPKTKAEVIQDLEINKAETVAVDIDTQTIETEILSNAVQNLDSEITSEQEISTKKMVEEFEVSQKEIVADLEPIEPNVESTLKKSNTMSEQNLDDDYAPITAKTKSEEEKSKNLVEDVKPREDFLYEKTEEKSNNIITKALFLVAGLSLLGYLIFILNVPSTKQSTQSVVDKKTCIANPKKMDIPTNLKIEDTLAGTGKEVFTGCQIKIHYKGYLLQTKEEIESKADLKVFDDSFKRGSPFSTQIGVGKLIKGWDIGIIGMKEGGKRKLTIPAELAYGAIEIPGIPANSTLVFEVELIQVLD